MRRHRRGGQWQYRGVSDHQIWPLVCHARGHRRGRSRHAVSVSAGVDDLLDATGAVLKGARNLHRRLHRPSHAIVRFAVARSRRSALLRPRCARLAALTARSANLEGNYRRPQREPLTTRATALLSNSLRRLRPATPFTSPDVEPSNRRPQVTIRFHSRFTSWSPTRATTRPRNRRSKRTALRPQARAPDPAALQDRHRHAATARRLSVVDASEPHSVLPIHAERHAKPASTLNMGRRIMAERRRHRRERRRQHRPHVRTNDEQPDRRAV